MTTYLALARTTPHEGGLRPGGPITRDVPTGTVHAAEPTAETTVCGLPVASFREVGPWGGGGPSKCDECRAVADQS